MVPVLYIYIYEFYVTHKLDWEFPMHNTYLFLIWGPPHFGTNPSLSRMLGFPNPPVFHASMRSMC